MCGRDILLLGKVNFEMEKANGGIDGPHDICPNRFPIAHEDALVAAVAVVFPIKIVVLLLAELIQQRWHEAETIDLARCTDTGNFGESRQDIPKCCRLSRGRASFDMAGPASNEGNANTAFENIFLEPTKWSSAAEKSGIRAAKCGTSDRYRW